MPEPWVVPQLMRTRRCLLVAVHQPVKPLVHRHQDQTEKKGGLQADTQTDMASRNDQAAQKDRAATAQQLVGDVAADDRSQMDQPGVQTVQGKRILALPTPHPLCCAGKTGIAPEARACRNRENAPTFP